MSAPNQIEMRLTGLGAAFGIRPAGDAPSLKGIRLYGRLIAEARRSGEKLVLENDERTAVFPDGGRNAQGFEAEAARLASEGLRERKIAGLDEIVSNHVQAGEIPIIGQIEAALNINVKSSYGLGREKPGIAADLPELLPAGARGARREVKNAELSQGVIAP